MAKTGFASKNEEGHNKKTYVSLVNHEEENEDNWSSWEDDNDTYDYSYNDSEDES